MKAFAAQRDITQGMMISSYFLNVRGKIFARFGRDRFVTKLSKARVDALAVAGKCVRFGPPEIARLVLRRRRGFCN